MVYNLTTMMGAQSIGQLAQSTNTILGGYYYGNFILLIIVFVIFIYMKTKGYNTMACALSSAWMLSILAFFLRPMDMISNVTFFSCIIVTVGTIACSFLFARGE